ncbi:hypothetical protein [Clostridium senegalense]
MLNVSLVLGILVSFSMFLLIFLKRKFIIKSYIESFYVMTYFNLCYLAYAIEYHSLISFKSLFVLALMGILYYISFDQGKYSYSIYGERGYSVDDLILYYLRKNNIKFKTVNNSYILYFYDEILKIEVNSLNICSNISLNTNASNTNRLDALAEDINSYFNTQRKKHSLKSKMLYSSFLFIFVILTVASILQLNNILI